MFFFFFFFFVGVVFLKRGVLARGGFLQERVLEGGGVLSCSLVSLGVNDQLGVKQKDTNILF